MTELSPAAQAIDEIIGDLYDKPVRCVVAAALRAVADKHMPEPLPFATPDFKAGAYSQQSLDRTYLLAIAAELEGASPPPTSNPTHRRTMLKPDHWIREQAANGMIAPFQPSLVRHLDPEHRLAPVLSYGCSSYGYDLRLSPKEFMIFRHVPGTVMNPKRFNPANLEPAELHQDADGSYFILPAHSYGLGVALERLRVPPYVTVICIGKSTYARLGIITNMTPAEAAWEGHLTLEFSNSSGADCRVYAGEGICQLLFFEGEPCEVSYADRAGKYQGQGESVVVARI